MKLKRAIFRLFIAVITIFIVLSISYRTYKSLIKIKEMNKELAENQKKYEKLKEEKEKLKKELEEAREGKNKERFVRDSLNMKKEGERVYKLSNNQEEKEQKEEKEGENSGNAN